MTMIYDNRPFEINVTSDLFGTHFKADAIKICWKLTMIILKE